MVKKVTTDTATAEVNETTAKKVAKKTASKKDAKQLTPEESVVILACLNKDFLEKMNKLAEKEGIKLVLTNEQVINDYVNQQSADSIDETARMTAFLQDQRNRDLALGHAKEIWRIMTNGKEIDEADGRVFEVKYLVKFTSLSWKKADEMLNTIEAFGFVKRLNKSTFTMNFNHKDIRDYICSQVILSVESLNYDIQRLKGAVKNSNDLSDDDKEQQLEETKQEIINHIVF